MGGVRAFERISRRSAMTSIAPVSRSALTLPGARATTLPVTPITSSPESFTASVN